MPNYKGHLVGGSIAYAVTLFLLRGWQPSILCAVEWFAFTLIGALFPDIDIKSKGQKLFYQGIGILFVFLVLQKQFQAIAFISFIALFPLVVRHRGITHSLWFILALCLSVLIFVHVQFSDYVAHKLTLDVIFFLVGAVSHLVLDRGFRRTFIH